MNILSTSFRWIKLVLLLLSISVCRSVYGQTGAAVTCSLASNPSVVVQNYGNPLIGCQYHFAVTTPGNSGSIAVGWSFPNAGNGVPPGVTIVSGSMSSATIDVIYSSTANTSQPIRGFIGSNTYVNGQYYLGTNDLSGVVIAASANPVCVNTPFTLSLSNPAGVNSVYWVGYTTSSNASNSFALQVPNGISGPTTFQVSVSGGCGSNSITVSRYITIIPLTDGASQAAGERDVVTGANQGVVTLTNYKGTIQYWQSSQDNGNTWATINQTTEELPYTNLISTTLYRAVTSLCGTNYNSTTCTVRVHTVTDDLSWTETKTFALDGTTLTSDSRTYVDGFAKPLQSQAKSLSTGRILATQPLYGKYDQAVGSTLAAPITPTDFAYQSAFITPTSAASAAYDYTRFDDGEKLNAPEAVSTTTRNTLGWYYSTSNDTEPYTATTQFPYSRTDAMPDGSTGVNRSVGPAPGQQLGSTREVVQGSFPIRAELDTYTTVRNNLLAATAVGGQVSTMQQTGVQQLSTDADGNTTLVFLDKEGHSVMSARPATTAVVAGQPDAWVTASSTVEVGWPYSIQLPANTVLSVPSPFVCTADIMVFDNQGNWQITGPPGVVANSLSFTGLYRFYSTSPFTIAASPSTGGPSTTYSSQQREAYAFFNFYLVGDGSATITSKSNTPTSVFSLVNTVTGQPVSYSANTSLPAGCYQLRIEKGAVNLIYTNRYKDLSYNFYNQKGQLVESIAPKGVQQLLQGMAGGGAPTQPAYATTFEYDQQSRQLAMNEPDAGRTEFLYRADGRLRFSQNAKQYKTGAMSYLGYDNIGRVVEVGECTDCLAANTSINTIPSGSNAWWIENSDYGGSGLTGYRNRRDVVRTTYDVIDPARSSTEAPNTSHNVSGYTAAFIAGRVATITKYSAGSPYNGYTRLSQTWYSYDEQGRTQWQIQQTAGQPARTIDYTYDAVGNTATVCYQKSTPTERLTHYYNYDADNRLNVVTSDNIDPANTNFYSVFGRVRHAVYSYYLHGPLKRITYGGTFFSPSPLQGVDYTYTAAGQLKAINDGELLQDPGKDGLGTGNTQYPDFFGTSLNYYQNDYTSAAAPTVKTVMSTGATDFVQHYNGLVSGMSWQTPASALNGYGYNYDYKGQLIKANYGLLTSSAGRQYNFVSDPNRYQEGNLDYDPNGNIGHLQRTDGMGAATLASAYQYTTGTNQLSQITSAGNPLVSYAYNEIGQVVSQQEKPSGPASDKYFDYDASGKVTALYANAGRTQVIARYTYDEFGKRLIQQVYPNPLDQSTYTTTTFVRDAAGHELASYVATTTPAVPNPPAQLYEQPIYGATRLGIYRQARDQTPAEQLYELNDQLGNTRVVFRQPVSTTYVLSMEDGRATQEIQDFPGPYRGAYYAVRSSDFALSASPYNYSSPNYSVKLLGQQGPTKTIAAQKGDKLHLTAYAFYPADYTTPPTQPQPPMYELTSPTRNAGVVGLAGIHIGAMPRIQSVPEQPKVGLSSWQRALSQLSLGVSIPLLAKSKPDPSQSSISSFGGNNVPPNAVLQYLIRKASDNSLVRSGSTPMPAGAGSDWQQMVLDVTITENYPVLVEVSNQSYDNNVTAYFDDLTVQYTPGPVIEENHYYAYGQRLDGLSWRRTDERVYGRGYQGQNTTQDAESGYTAFDLRMYDTRFGRWLAVDPAKQFSSPYVGIGNNPVSGIDRDGGVQEYPDDYTGKLGKGDWLASDRINNTSTWQNANIYNLSLSKGYNEYSTISQRSDFYKWFASDIAAKGFEVNWPGAASVVAAQMANLDNSVVAWWVGKDVVKFGNEGNTAIFNDVFDNLAVLRNGPVLKGEAASSWDAVTLHHEQYDVVQPIYMRQSSETIGELTKMAKVQNTYRFGATGGLRFEGSLLSPADRYNYGATKATFMYKLQTTYGKLGW